MSRPAQGRKTIGAAEPRAAAPKPRGGARGVNQTSPLLDAREASRMLGVPHTWLLAQARADAVPHHRLGHYVRFDPDELIAWTENNRRGPGAPRATP